MMNKAEWNVSSEYVLITSPYLFEGNIFYILHLVEGNFLDFKENVQIAVQL